MLIKPMLWYTCDELFSAQRMDLGLIKHWLVAIVDVGSRTQHARQLRINTFYILGIVLFRLDLI